MDLIHQWQLIVITVFFLNKYNNMLISPTNLIARVKILLNFSDANKASKDNFHENKRTIWALFMTKGLLIP